MGVQTDSKSVEVAIGDEVAFRIEFEVTFARGIRKAFRRRVEKWIFRPSYVGWSHKSHITRIEIGIQCKSGMRQERQGRIGRIELFHRLIRQHEAILDLDEWMNDTLLLILLIFLLLLLQVYLVANITASVAPQVNEQ